jgi:hypothetical protein
LENHTETAAHRHLPEDNECNLFLVQVMKVGYRIQERFSPEGGDRWSKYIQWSGLVHLKEVVGLDCLLCPSVLREYVDEDWPHLILLGHIFACFDDVQYALNRIGKVFNDKRHQVLAVAREPAEEQVLAARLSGFRFLGYELIEEATSISALTNCGGFDNAFAPADLSEYGLILTAGHAREIQRSLADLFPNEHHAECAVWAVWRREIALPADAVEPAFGGLKPKAQ